MKDLELKEAASTLLEYRRLERIGSSKAYSPYWVFKVYRAVHKIYPYIVESSESEEVRKIHLTHPAAASHYYDMFNDIVETVTNGKRLSIASIIRMELASVSLEMHEHIPNTTIGGLTGAVTVKVLEQSSSKNFGRDNSRTEPSKSLNWIDRTVFMSKWMCCENHLNDMINLCLTCLMIVKKDDIGLSIRTNTSFK